MTVSRRIARALSGSVLVLAACNRQVSVPAPPGTDPGLAVTAAATSNAAVSDPGHRPPTGTTCGGRDDCPGDQVCVEGRCRHRETSVAGEILAASAAALADAGDWEGAQHTYVEAETAFREANAPVPAEVLCAHAALLLSTATTPEARDEGASRADACFRASLPGFGPREAVGRAVARLRFQGLDVHLFDQAAPASHFFTQAQSPPTVDAVVVELVYPTEGEQPGPTALRPQLDADAARRAIAECFIQDWGVHHARSTTGSLVVRYSTRLRDMGTYDSYEPELLVEKTTVAEDGFEPCVASALGSTLTAPRSGRVVSWQFPLEVSAHIQ